MYIPSHFKQNNEEILLAYMQAFSFATLVSATDNKPTATHLPFIVKKEGNQIKLYSHMARANPQWQLLKDKEALVIFAGPHGYVSPSHYTSPLNVPTWNYIAVHAYGQFKIISNTILGNQLLEEMVMQYDPAYMEQFKAMPNEFKMNMYKGLIPFEIVITELQGKEKLSQNKKSEERSNVAKHFEEVGETMLANKMKEQP